MILDPKVFIGSPIRNRGWVLPRHLDSLLNQEGIEKQFCYVVNNCTDDTVHILQKYGINYCLRNLPEPTSKWTRGHYSKPNLALLRNFFLKKFLESDCEYLFSVDSDVIVPENGIKHLIEDDKDIISMILNNSDVKMAHNIWNYAHFLSIPYGIIDCLITGAAYLIKRKVIEAGVKYYGHSSGEDIPFCESAKEKGFGIFCDTRVQAIHAFRPGLDLYPRVEEPK